MTSSFVEIDSVAALDRFIENANGTAAVLFKHSNTCGVSSRAYSEMSTVTYPVGIVVVQNARSISDEIERRWRVDHQTPQVLIIKDGRVAWNASHFQVKASDVETALRQLAEHGER